MAVLWGSATVLTSAGNPEKIQAGKTQLSAEELKAQEEEKKRLAEEMEKRRRKESSELVDILIARRWQELLGPFVKDPSEVRPS